MSRRTLQVVLLALLIVGGLSFAAAELWIAPGHAVPGHQAIAHDCFACHRPFRGTPAERCVACHSFDRTAPVEANGKIQPGTTLFALHRELASRNCTNCHTDHLTREITSATPRFDHGMLGAATGAACATCHRPPRDRLHPQAGERCADCHGTKAWKPATFDHRAFFPLDPPHDASCATCHTGRDFRQYTCMGCHEHSPEKLAREHAEEGIRNLDRCVRCHRNGEEHEGREHDGER